MLSWGMLFLSVFCNAFSVFIIKKKLNHFGPIELSSIHPILNFMGEVSKSPFGIASIALFILAPFFFAIALSRLDLSVAYPVQIGLNFLLLVFMGVFFLGEAMSAYRWIGIFLAFASICLLQTDR